MGGFSSVIRKSERMGGGARKVGKMRSGWRNY